MKLLLTLSLSLGLVLSASVASAKWSKIDENSSWEEIYQAGLIPRGEQINFGSTLVSVIGICLDGDNLRPFDPYQKVCVGHGGGDSTECTQWEIRYLSTPRTYTYEVCVKWSQDEQPVCLVSETHTATHPLSYTVPVYSIQSGGESESYKLEFNKQHNVPACN